MARKVWNFEISYTFVYAKVQKNSEIRFYSEISQAWIDEVVISGVSTAVLISSLIKCYMHFFRPILFDIITNSYIWYWYFWETKFNSNLDQNN